MWKAVRQIVSSAIGVVLLYGVYKEFLPVLKVLFVDLWKSHVSEDLESSERIRSESIRSEMIRIVPL